MQERRPGRTIEVPKKRQDSPVVRTVGIAFASLMVGGGLLACVLALVAIVAGLWRFVCWAVGA